jgi:hypothetical protein
VTITLDLVAHILSDDSQDLPWRILNECEVSAACEECAECAACDGIPPGNCSCGGCFECTACTSPCITVLPDIMA